MMKTLAVALGALVIPACVDSGGASTISQTIVGGETANPADYRAVVALENGPGEWFCTGTLIADQWILTAAHCVDGATPANLKIRFDDANVNDTTGGIEVDVAEVHAHPGFDWEAWDNDIALVKLAAPVTDREPTPILRDEVPFGTPVVDVGYGAASNDEDDDQAGLLRRVSKTTADCAGAGDPGVSSANLVCMDAADGKGSCFGDSGGPTYATVNGKLVVAGVTSGGTGELCGAGWDLYTSVHAELDFIDTTMGAIDPGPGPDPEPDPDPDPNPEPGPSGDPTEPGGTPGGADTDDGGGCNTGRGNGGALVLAMAGLALARRRRRASVTSGA